MARSISRSRPMTGSIFPTAASSVRSRPYWSSVFVSAARRVWDRGADCCGRGLYSGRPNTSMMSV